jgi:hypothetical protein
MPYTYGFFFIWGMAAIAAFVLGLGWLLGQCVS